MNNFKLICPDRSNYEISYTKKVFPGGEVQVRVGKLPVIRSGEYFGNVIIDGLIKNSEMLMEMMLLTNALKKLNSFESVVADLHYLPYARQDRVCVQGEAFSLEVMINILNACDADYIVFDDAHSDVAEDLSESASSASKFIFRSKAGLIAPHIDNANITLVSPDAGASRDVKSISMHTKLPLVSYEKKRNPNTGTIESTELIHGSEFIEGSHCLIMDDICDGGRTFIPIIKDLYELGAGSVSLCVTHALLPYAAEALTEAGLCGLFYVNKFFDEELLDMHYISEIKEILNGYTK